MEKSRETFGPARGVNGDWRQDGLLLSEGGSHGQGLARWPLGHHLGSSSHCWLGSLVIPRQYPGACQNSPHSHSLPSIAGLPVGQLVSQSTQAEVVRPSEGLTKPGTGQITSVVFFLLK